MNGVRGEGGMKEGGAGNDWSSSGTIAIESRGGLRAAMGQNAGGGRFRGQGGEGRRGVDGGDAQLGFGGYIVMERVMNTTEDVFARTLVSSSNRTAVGIQKGSWRGGTTSDRDGYRRGKRGRGEHTRRDLRRHGYIVP